VRFPFVHHAEPSAVGVQASELRASPLAASRSCAGVAAPNFSRKILAISRNRSRPPARRA
jgi:hypothetical protein